ncbi:MULTISPECIES: regulatory protein RecX [unclassified Halanaerobium]|uniref:regulatory protein RecX n=1 Tax=unclassified Halanaerobium TaxID=2641197 RepID=UPI000DF3BEA3|nr:MULTISPECIES: regulatory protein RecX [unclassified Halanaerobium]RCW51512.1 regulatory protein [Halanaerobium sp. MA284_MarDTE_T2]RCW89300.1 regulatory protein [Halanaerobium sp. DL-01]
MDLNEIQKAKNKAFHLLTYRERTVKEMQDRLFKKGFNNDVIEQTINYLLENDLINEDRFAEQWIRSRINNHPRGKKLIYRELLKKGLNRSLIDKALNKYLSPEQEIEMAKTLIKKWLRKHKEEDKGSLKLKNYLSNKGFSYDIINKTTD